MLSLAISCRAGLGRENDEHDETFCRTLGDGVFSAGGQLDSIHLVVGATLVLCTADSGLRAVKCDISSRLGCCQNDSHFAVGGRGELDAARTVELHTFLIIGAVVGYLAVAEAAATNVELGV